MTSRWLRAPGPARRPSGFAPGGIERLVFERGVTRQELVTFVRRLARIPGQPGGRGRRGARGIGARPHIRVGRLRVQRRIESGRSDIRGVQGAYQDAVAGAEQLWEQARAEGCPDPAMAAGARGGPGQRRRARTAARCSR